MKIVIASGIFAPESGGPATYAPRLAAGLAGQGIETVVVAYSDRPHEDGDENYPFALVRVTRGNKLLNRIRFFWALWRASRGADVIYTLDWFAAGLPVMCAAWLSDIPYVVRVGGDYLWERHLESADAGVTLEDFYKHGIYYTYERRLAARIIRAVLRGAARVVFNSDRQRELYRKHLGLEVARTLTIYNPVPRIDAGTVTRDASNKEIVFWGRLIVMKNVASLIRAFRAAALPDEYTLTIIGSGPQEEALRKLATDLHLEARVKFEPALPRDEVLARVRNARAFVLPSWTDISPNQVYEAMVLGLPGLVTQENYLPIRDKLPEMIGPRSTEDIADKLRMLADDEQYAKFAASWREVSFDYSWDQAIAAHREIFDVVTGHERATSVVAPAAIRVLQIGADRSPRGILYPDSPAVERQKAYGAQFANLDIIGFSRRSDRRAPFDPAPAVHIHPTNSWVRLLYMWDAIRITRHLLRPDVVSVQDPFETGICGLIVSRMFGVPLHVQVHTDVLSPAYAHQSLLNRIRVLVARFTLSYASRVRVVSGRIKRSLEGGWRIAAPISVLPIYADTARIRAVAGDADLSVRFAAFTHRILVVARLEPEKNVGLAVHAFAKAAIPDACLIIVGDGSEHGRLTALARQLGIHDRTFFEGGKDAAPYYHLTDLVLVPSLYEGYGLVIVEALAAGRTVISTDVGCAREMGALIAAPHDFARKIVEYFASKEDRPPAPSLSNYPYKSFEDYAKKYAEDIAASLA